MVLENEQVFDIKVTTISSKISSMEQPVKQQMKFTLIGIFNFFHELDQVRVKEFILWLGPV